MSGTAPLQKLRVPRLRELVGRAYQERAATCRYRKNRDMRRERKRMCLGLHRSRSCGCRGSGNSSAARVRNALPWPPAATAVTTGALALRACGELQQQNQYLFLSPHFQMSSINGADRGNLWKTRRNYLS